MDYFNNLSYRIVGIAFSARTQSKFQRQDCVQSDFLFSIYVILDYCRHYLEMDVQSKFWSD